MSDGTEDLVPALMYVAMVPVAKGLTKFVIGTFGECRAKK